MTLLIPKASPLSFLVILYLFWGLPAFGATEEIRYPSGLLHSYGTDSATDLSLSEKEAFHKLVAKDFPDGDLEWREYNHIVDNTHIHRLYALYFKRRRVADQFLKTHYNRAGFMQYVTSGLRHPISQLTLTSAPKSTVVRNLWKKKFDSQYRTPFKGAIDLDPIIYLDEVTGKATPAYEMKVRWFARGLIRDMYVDEKTGALLAEKNLFRFVTQANKGFNVNPDYALPTAGTPEDLTLTLDAATAMKNSHIWVRRDERDYSQSGVFAIQEVSAVPDYTNAGTTLTPVYSADPDQYAGDTCSTTSDQPVAGTLCANQSLDASNVYYHLSEFRSQLDTYFATLGLTSTVNAIFSSLEPLWVIVNSLSVDVNGDGDPSNDTNNAAYIPSTCREDQSSTSARCLIFLRPDTINTTSCSWDNKRIPVPFYDLAREANVVVHEYQHYITDQLTHMVAGTSLSNVGDALHEGYSDYFGASQVVATSGISATKIGEYAFKACTRIIRDVAVLRVYENGAEEEDPHTSGLSWASGLWQLRNQLGRTNADLLALKSLTFLSTKPSFIEAVEALVKADDSLNAGANITAIRTLFYDDIKFVGGQSGLFRDSSKGILEMGLRSCLSVPSRTYTNIYLTAMFFLVWLLFTVATGRRLGRR